MPLPAQALHRSSSSCKRQLCSARQRAESGKRASAGARDSPSHFGLRSCNSIASRVPYLSSPARPRARPIHPSHSVGCAAAAASLSESSQRRRPADGAAQSVGSTGPFRTMLRLARWRPAAPTLPAPGTGRTGRNRPRDSDSRPGPARRAAAERRADERAPKTLTAVDEPGPGRLSESRGRLRAVRPVPGAGSVGAAGRQRARRSIVLKGPVDPTDCAAPSAGRRRWLDSESDAAAAAQATK